MAITKNNNDNYRTDMNDNKTFLGNGWSFPPALERVGTPTRMAAYEEKIRQSLWTLLSISPGERVHRYDYGCLVRRYVFEAMDIPRRLCCVRQ